jgi:hypothetical protein
VTLFAGINLGLFLQGVRSAIAWACRLEISRRGAPGLALGKEETKAQRNIETKKDAKPPVDAAVES